MRTAFLIGLLALSSVASAQDIELQWQSRLFDSEGQSIDGTVAVELRIVDDEGAVSWVEELTLTAADGYVSHILGRTESLALAQLPEPAFLDIRIDGVSLGEARRLATTPLAARALAVPVSTDSTQWSLPCDGVGRLAWNEDAKTLYVCDNDGEAAVASTMSWQPFLPDRRECLPGQVVAMNGDNTGWMCVDAVGGGVVLPVTSDAELFDTTCQEEGALRYKTDSDQLLTCQADDLGNLYWTARGPDRRECGPDQLMALDADGAAWTCVDAPSGSGGGTATGIATTTNATLYDMPCAAPGQLVYNTDQHTVMVCDDAEFEGELVWTPMLPDTSDCAEGERLVVDGNGRWACETRAAYVGTTYTFEPCAHPYYPQQPGTELCAALDPTQPTVVWTQPGHQLWRVPVTASYSIDAHGSAGGTNGGGLGGSGAVVSVGLDLLRGDILRFVIGHFPGVQACSTQGAGGGGATTVLRRLRASELSSVSPNERVTFDDGAYVVLAVAGGGGGASGYRGTGACVEPGGDAPIDALPSCTLAGGLSGPGTTDVNFADYSGPGGGLTGTHTNQQGGVNLRAGNGLLNAVTPAVGGIPENGYLQGNGGYGGGGASLHPDDYDGVVGLPDGRTVGGGGGGFVGGSTSMSAGLANGGTSCARAASLTWQAVTEGSHIEGGKVVVVKAN